MSLFDKNINNILTYPQKEIGKNKKKGEKMNISIVTKKRECIKNVKANISPALGMVLISDSYKERLKKRHNISHYIIHDGSDTEPVEDYVDRRVLLCM